MLRDALSAPIRGRDSFGTTVIGSVLVAIGIVLAIAWMAAAAVVPFIAVIALPIVAFPILVSRGYRLRVINDNMQNRPETPSFVGWGGLARGGLGSIVLSGLYLLPLAAFTLFAGIPIVTYAIFGSASNPTGRLLATIAAALGGLFMIGYLLVYAYIRPAAETVFASTGRISAAVSPKRVLSVALTGRFTTAWIVAVGVFLTGTIVGILTFPLLVGTVVLFLTGTVVAALIGSGASTAATPATAAGGGTSEEPTRPQPDRSPAPITTTPTVLPDGDWRPTEAPADVQVGRSAPLTENDPLAVFEPATLIDPEQPSREVGFQWGQIEDDRGYEHLEDDRGHNRLEDDSGRDHLKVDRTEADG
ncbi:DUF4013 domain-containing protein [Halalkalirubrum salinum]|uniref:DUF4013 domain-containing protein n=1 Tax=Halalkalirubrum salinum TaxID=2563889 RepID=UPI0010FB83C5|nr:DUF4013 domain-containing protein [Halalkalirubrum salinum]